MTWPGARALVCLVLRHHLSVPVLARESGTAGNQPLRVDMFRSFLLVLLASSLSITITGASSFHLRSSQQVRQTSGSAHDSLCKQARN
ncbi:hypothetical protein F5888DRAFT_631996 [Russula emetica]|nr:hypothetical protein F5888DRAFT_631996 [Russula emetica]